MIRSGDIVVHTKKLYKDIGGLKVSESGVSITPHQLVEDGTEVREAIVQGSAGELLDGYGGGNNEIRGRYSIQYFDTGHSLAWVDKEELEFVCTAKDYIIKQLNELCEVK